MRPGVGSGGSYFCVGVMVDRQSVGTGLLFSSDLGDVSTNQGQSALLQALPCTLYLADNNCSMSNRRSDLAEMTALYLIPIVATVIAATSGGLIAGVLADNRHQVWTLVISYILWGIGTPLSWMILTIYFLRMTVHHPVEREVIVSLLLPIGPLGLSGFSYVDHNPHPNP
jgi:uncharacterized membrane protein YciS (DUF1049 family)